MVSICNNLFIPSFFDGHLGCFHLFPLWIVLLWICMYICLLKEVFLFLSGIHLGVELWNHIVILFSPFWGTTKLFSTVTGPFYFTANNIQKFPISPHPRQHLLCSIAVLFVVVFIIIIIIAILVDVKRYFIIVFICIFLIVKDIEHFSCPS